MTLTSDHRYLKMPEDVSNTIALEIIKTHNRDIASHFKRYDTEYDVGYYNLPDTDLLLILLMSFEDNCSGGANGRLWTTLRKYTPEKELYYRTMRGKSIEIEITHPEALG